MGNVGSAHNLQNDGIQSELNMCYTQEYLRRASGENRKKNISVLGGWTGGRNMVDCTVLPPKPNENVKLRATTNGAILQAGGTISFRAKALTDRNKSPQFLPMRRCHTLILDGQNDIISQRKSAPNLTEFRRSQTLILVGHNKRKVQENSLKGENFHSQSPPQNISSTSTLKVNKVNKYNKKRKAPPAPTKLLSNDDKTSRVQNQVLKDSKNTTVAKSRIFTSNTNKALTTQKPSQSMKVTLFQRDSNVRTSVNSPSQIQHSNSSNVSNLPYRREKSFDAKLLRQRKQSDIKPSIETGKQSLASNINTRKLESDNKYDGIGMKQISRKLDSVVTQTKGLSTYKKTYELPTDYNKERSKVEAHSAQDKTTMLTLNKKTKNDNFAQYSSSTNERKTKSPLQSRIPQLKRTFYFGMESVSKSPNRSTPIETLKSIDYNKKTPNEDNVNMQTILNHKVQDEEIMDNGILVHIRPTLPRRQLDAPSFSPVAAWRNLLEEQQGLQLERSKLKQHSIEQRLAETPICLQTAIKENYVSKTTDWIPQQDLKDDEENEVPKPENCINSSHVFSLSLPRDVHLQQSKTPKEYNYQEKQLQSANCWLVPGFNSLQKFKTQLCKSTDLHSNTKCTCDLKQSYKRNSYQLDNNFADSFLTETKRYHQPDCDLNKTLSKPTRYQIGNWFLDKSKDKLLNNSTEILDDNCLKPSANSPSFTNLQPKFLSNICTGKHIVYLPGQETFINATNDSNKNSKSNKPNYKKQRQRQENVRENLQDLTPIQNIHQSNASINEKNTHRFSFQSTVRVLEKRKLAEKLSRNAEVQEAQRLHELEAIKRVEEDFQRKRAPEKANLRNQLRLHFKATAENNEYRSLPLNINEKLTSQQISDANNNIFCRAEPDGAVSPSAELNDDLLKPSFLLTTAKNSQDLNCLEYDGEDSESETQLPNLQCNSLLIAPYINSII